MTEQSIYNFSPGPAMLPSAVLERAAKEMSNWQGLGLSVMEVSHRHPAFVELVLQTENLLRHLMAIPDNYRILFLHGGANTQFSMVPMNLLAQNKSANYLVTGRWSKGAYDEAQKYGDIHLVASSKNDDYKTIPAVDSWRIDENAQYFYYTPNETFCGVEFPSMPDVSMPLVADMTSCILSRSYPIEKFGLIFASAQKNMGAAGVTTVIVREDLVVEPPSYTPSMLDYRNHIAQHSLFNTAPSYAIYIMNLVLEDLAAKGGVSEIEKVNKLKAKMLYDMIDQSDFYTNSITPEYRSRMNVTFNLPSPELEALFVASAEENELVNLKGHKSVGGIRASIYNAMPVSGVEALINFMCQFEKENA